MDYDNDFLGLTSYVRTCLDIIYFIYKKFMEINIQLQHLNLLHIRVKVLKIN